MISQSTLAIAIVVAFVIGAVLIFRTVQDMRSVHKAVKREPLPDHEIVTMYAECPRSDAEMIDFARAIERAHGIGGSDAQAEPKREPLSDERIDAALQTEPVLITRLMIGSMTVGEFKAALRRVARIIEHAHGIGGSDAE